MIYICKPCELGCKGCEQSCSGCNKACKETCEQVGDICKKPMGGWVLCTILCMVLCLAGAAYAVAKFMDVKSCDEPKIVSCVNIGISIMHACIAVYVQSAIYSQVHKMREAITIQQTTPVDESEITHAETVEATKHIIKYDFGFCFYAFALPAATFYNCYGISKFQGVEGCGDGGVGPGFSTCMGLIGYGFVTMAYIACTFCGTCCASQTKKAKVKVGKKDKKGAKAEPIGASYA